MLLVIWHPLFVVNSTHWTHYIEHEPLFYHHLHFDCFNFIFGANHRKKYRYPTVVLYTSRSNRNFKLLKQLLGPPSTSSTTTSSSKHAISIPRSTRKQTPTVTHQFQQSLQQLMDTLSHANPFFVRCIKSNAEKMPNHFDDRLVLMQLRYTGMLETVRIRQSGYSVRLTFDEFIQHYRILLPRGLVSSKMDVKVFLQNMNLKPDMYQIGITKIFMRESEKLSLDEQLHQQILKRIITLQRWVSFFLISLIENQSFTHTAQISNSFFSM